jgi:hypothetical protein
LNFFINNLGFLRDVWRIVKKTDYKGITNNLYDIKALWFFLGAPSDVLIFALKRPLCKTVCFLKGPPWKLNHRN